MDSVGIRVFTFSVLPVVIAAGHLGLDRSSRTRERRLEIFLLYLFGVGVAGSGIGGFFGHVFISDPVAESIGWPTGNPFQLEVGVANLAVGILGIVAMSRRDGFREAPSSRPRSLASERPRSMSWMSSSLAISLQATPSRTSAISSGQPC
jgi:hypothetical protein